jgi:putative heme-binding domain-containing protein
VGPPLDHLASRRAPEFIMESILQPSKDIDPQYEAIQVVTNQGLIITGLRVNETNFSVQLREENGRFHSFEKRELESVQVMKKSLMPEDIAEHLSVKELHNLFSFLLTLE